MDHKKCLVLVPYCVRNIRCKADIVEGELLCAKSDCQDYSSERCGIYDLLEQAKIRNLGVRIIFRDDSIDGIISEEEPDVVLGLTCQSKIEEIIPAIEARGIECHSVSLEGGSTCFKQTGSPSDYLLEKYVALLESK